MLSVTATSAPGGDVLALRGDLDVESVVQLKEAATMLLERPEGPRLVVLDCSDLTFCDSSGINCFLTVYRRLAAVDAELRLAAVPTMVARICSLTGIDAIVPLHASVAEALDAGAGSDTSGAQAREESAR